MPAGASGGVCFQTVLDRLVGGPGPPATRLPRLVETRDPVLLCPCPRGCFGAGPSYPVVQLSAWGPSGTPVALAGAQLLDL